MRPEIDSVHIRSQEIFQKKRMKRLNQEKENKKLHRLSGQEGSFSWS